MCKSVLTCTVFQIAHSHRMRTCGALALRFLGSGVPVARMADLSLNALDPEPPCRRAQPPRPRLLPAR
eukprot:4957590-Pleurochrysis_carterae.AAC.1